MTNYGELCRDVELILEKKGLAVWTIGSDIKGGPETGAPRWCGARIIDRDDYISAQVIGWGFVPDAEELQGHARVHAATFGKYRGGNSDDYVARALKETRRELHAHFSHYAPHDQETKAYRIPTEARKIGTVDQSKTQPTDSISSDHVATG